MSEDTPEKILTPTQAQQLLEKLKSKYGSELQSIQDMIHHDIKIFGYVSFHTKTAQTNLAEKILAEECDE